MFVRDVSLALMRCCMVEEGFEISGGVAIVPWGAEPFGDGARVTLTNDGAPSLIALYFSWRDGETAEEANHLRGEANGLREESKTQVTRIANLTEELNTERNKHLQQIAQNIKQPLSQAEKNGVKLRKYLRKKTTVSEGNGTWGAGGAEIVEVSEDNILTLFSPAGYSSSAAFAVYVRCDELELIEAPLGGCDLQIRILKRYGDKEVCRIRGRALAISSVRG
jgi:hypothetical protein